jgi:ubiquinone/menaquinone biosynthesis C-methylase UbiE
MHFLDKYLPESRLILDAGGGPGRYTIELAKKGYDVVLLDLSPECLKLARKKIKEAGVESKVKKIVEGPVTDLSMFEDNLFDAILCLGPLSHLIEEKDREKAANELIRVAKPRTHLFVSVINRYGVFRTVLQRYPYNLTEPTHREMFEKGIHRAEWHKDLPEDKGFMDAYFFHPNELKQLFENKGVETVDMVACEGLSAHLQEETNKIYENKEKWKRWVQIILQTCNDPTIIGVSEHILYIGRKR